MKISHKKTLLLALLSWKAFSADAVNIGVTGNIVASPCVFNGEYESGYQPRQYSGFQYGDARVHVRPGCVRSALYRLSAGNPQRHGDVRRNPDPATGADYYMNSGSATGVAVAMSDAATGSLKGTGSSITKAIAADSTATMPMQAWVKSASGGTTPGSISAVVVMTMQYN